METKCRTRADMTRRSCFAKATYTNVRVKMDERQVTEKLFPFMFHQNLYFDENLRNSDLGQKLTGTFSLSHFYVFNQSLHKTPTCST